MPTDEYTRLCEYSGALEENWGKPPGNLNSSGNDLLIYGKQYGNVFIGVQPTFGYEGDPMRLLFSRSASPHHGFAAYYTFVEKVFKADAVLHFGTHGSLEFMPGKQVGMSGGCFPDALIGNLPNLYYYAANNPSEATIAKRRSYANTISYLTPPAENAGLYKGLKELKELIASYQSMREGGRGEQICATIVETARRCNLDRDVDLPADDAALRALSLDARDLVVGNVYRKLMEIESRLLPCGLHVVGVMPTAEEAIATLVNIAELDRPDQLPVPILGMPGIMARAIGREIDDIYRSSDKGVLADVDLLQRITEASRLAVREFVRDRTGLDGRIGTNPMAVLAKFCGLYVEPWVRALQKTEFGKSDRAQLVTLFGYLEFCLSQIVQDNELGALSEALNGQYVLPGPGGDPVSFFFCSSFFVLLFLLFFFCSSFFSRSSRARSECAPSVSSSPLFFPLLPSPTDKLTPSFPSNTTNPDNTDTQTRTPQHHQIRNPGVLPTGKNIHALDPQSIPTAAAIKSAEAVVDRLLARERDNNGGKYPETIALVLWGTDNIKTYGE